MNPLVSPAWVAERLRKPGLAGVVVVDATLPPLGVKPPPDMRARYLVEHLPGAVFFDIEALSEKATPLPHMLPSPERFARDMAELGVGDGMTIVVYEQDDVFSAPRGWWTLRAFGCEEVYVLDGGLRAWVEAGLPTEAGTVSRAKTMFHARLRPETVKSFADVQGILARGEQLVDARSSGRFLGTAPEPRPGLRSGHMPGAMNVPYTDLAEANRLKSPAELRAVFAERHVELGRPITTTCGSGVTAAVVSLALEICGAADVSLYDGSWAEYAQQPEAIVETAG